MIVRHKQNKVKKTYIEVVSFYRYQQENTDRKLQTILNILWTSMEQRANNALGSEEYKARSDRHSSCSSKRLGSKGAMATDHGSQMTTEKVRMYLFVRSMFLLIMSGQVGQAAFSIKSFNTLVNKASTIPRT
jgi:hypothetical protein